MSTENIVAELQKILKGDVSVSDVDRETYARDTSLFYVKPEIVVFPKDKEDLQELVKFVSKKKDEGKNISITARSAGSDMTGGPLTQSIVVVFTKYMNHMLEINKDFATAEPGMYYRDFEKETLKFGWIMPSYPASREICAIGGIVSNNSGGEKTLSYGKTERYVKALDVVFANGERDTIKELNKQELEEKMKENTESGRIHREIFNLISNNEELIRNAKPTVSKNSSGYYIWNVYDKEKGTFDLNKMIVGSQGTLCMVTSAKLVGMAPKKYSKMVVVFLKDLSRLGEIIVKFLEHKPESFESYDDHTFNIALKFLPSIMKKMGGNFFTLGFQFIPEVLMVIRGGVPKLIIMAEFTGDNQEEVDGNAKKAFEDIKSFGYQTELLKDEQAAKKYWTFRRESFNLLRTKLKGYRTAPSIDDIIVHPADLPKFIPDLENIFKKYDLIYSVAGHIGDANFHIVPLVDMKKEGMDKIIHNLMDEIYDLILKYKGSFSAEHNDGITRTAYLPKMFGEEVNNIFKDIKNIFDPKDIFNPHKKVNGNPNDFFKYIDRA